jgi:hypothetical protein
MRLKHLFYILCLACLLPSCGDRFENGHRYTGDYVICDSVFAGGIFSYDQYFYASIYSGEKDELVLQFDRGPYAIVLQLGKEGSLTGSDASGPIEGSFSDRNHFRLRHKGERFWNGIRLDK